MEWWDYPSKLTLLAEFWANVATIAGAGALVFVAKVGVDIRAEFRASVEIQRQDALSRQLDRFQIDAGAGAQKVISSLLHWAKNGKYPAGYSEAEMRRLAKGSKDERATLAAYLEWVTYMVIMFDLATRDPVWETDTETQDEIALIMRRHSAALTTRAYGLHPSRARLASSKLVRRAIRSREAS